MLRPIHFPLPIRKWKINSLESQNLDIIVNNVIFVSLYHDPFIWNLLHNQELISSTVPKDRLGKDKEMEGKIK